MLTSFPREAIRTYMLCTARTTTCTKVYHQPAQPRLRHKTDVSSAKKSKLLVDIGHVKRTNIMRTLPDFPQLTRHCGRHAGCRILQCIDDIWWSLASGAMDDSLPEGWMMHRSKAGETFFHHFDTGTNENIGFQLRTHPSEF